jgi:N-acyl-D-aspartate/D-glutamate deacylase
MDGILLRGGLVYDGSGAEGVQQDVLIVGESVRQVGAGLDATAEDVTVIDCTDLAVAPGFIDIHGHSDFSVLAHPLAESRVAAGVTTEVTGNCGVSAYPLGGQLTERRRLQLVSTGVDPTWTDAQGYYDAVAKTGCSMNIAVLVGHGNLRAVTVGYDDRPASTDELDAMKRLLIEGIEAGAYGMSTGLVYAPGCYGTTEEVVELARVVGRRGGIYASHIRNEGPRLLEAAREFLTIVEASGCRGIYSHIKTMGPTNWHKIDELIAMITEARGRGLDVFADRYPYLAGNTGLDSILFPNWVVEGTVDREVARLSDPALQDRLRQAVAEVRPEPDWPDRVRICGCSTQENAAVAGLSLRELAERWNTEPFEAAVRLLIEEQTCVTAVLFGMSEDNLRRFYGLPFVMVASDSSVRGLSTEGNARPHPRAFGTPARFLATYVRDEGLMTWGEGIHKLTGLPAKVMGWQRRGRLTRGAVADITVFDPDRLADRATYDQPIAAPAGIRHVLVAGRRVVTDGDHTGAKPGRIIKRGEPE